ncbi:endonuclease/exonuclease/phosphatase family protein [Kitasatospora sp. NPDC088779]|uniref:endonuclease/exonuclease/phosphatase family protein n=1 Tax=Kitasatospora sp. NPDC088779 TaxID=3154964 RepID=UPI0034138CEB
MTTAPAPRPRRALLRAAILPAGLAASLVLVPLPAANAAPTAANAATNAANAAAPAGPTEAGPLRIHDIQGTTRISPQAGKPVTGVPGVVTGVRAYGSAKGFWMQDPNPDADPATSEGIFVYTGGNPTVKAGDSVLVSGKVTEYYPNFAGGSQSVTELTGPAVTVLSSGNPLPAPVVVDTRNIPGTYVPPAPEGGSIDALPLDPEKYALDFYESLEGMLVQVKDVRVIQATDKYNELWVAADRQDQRSKRGGVLYESYAEPNVGRLMVQQQAAVTPQQPFPVANVGDVLTGTTTGPLDYNQFGGYTLVAGTLGTLQDNHLQREVTAKAADRELAIATYNVENLAPGNPDAKFAELAQGIVTNLRSPDIVALEEIQDNNGAKNDGTVDASQTVAKFIAAIKAAGGPAYDWRSIDPQDGKDGGEPGGNIRQVFLFNPQRVSFTDIPGGAASAVDVAGSGATTALTASPGRIAPTDDAWTNSRKPLVGQFSFRGKKVFVIANHFNSKGGDQGIDSRFQAPTRSSEVQRVKQATIEQAFVAKLLAADKEARVVSLGDFNDYQFSPALAALTKDGVLRDLVNELPETEQYSYVYQGNSQVLDHILVSPEVGYAKYDVVHINAEFAQQASDHDPQVVRIKP